MTDLTNPRFLEAVAYIYPNAKLTGPPRDRDVQLANDGTGPVIKVWNIPGPIPTDAEVAAALAAIDQQATAPFFHEQYNAMIRRRAAALEAAGDQVGALLLLHTIGE